MDQNRVNRRRSTIFERIQFELTQSSVIKKKLSPGKFPASSVGVVKVIAVILLLIAVLIFVIYDTCPNTSNWYEWLFTLANCLGAGITILFYGIFTLGIARNFTKFWFVTDIVFCVLIALFIVITSVITIQECPSNDSMYKVPGPLAIGGAVFIITAAAGLYIMYRHSDSNEDLLQVKRNNIDAINSNYNKQIVDSCA